MKATRLTDANRKPEKVPSVGERIAQQIGWLMNVMKPGEARPVKACCSDEALRPLLIADIRAGSWPGFSIEQRLVQGVRGPGPLHVVRADPGVVPAGQEEKWRKLMTPPAEAETPEQRRAREQVVEPIDDRPFPENPKSYEFVCVVCKTRKSMSLLGQDTPRSGMRCVTCGPLQPPATAKPSPAAAPPGPKEVAPATRPPAAPAAPGPSTAVPEAVLATSTDEREALRAFRLRLRDGDAFFTKGPSGLPQRFTVYRCFTENVTCVGIVGGVRFDEIYPDAPSCARAILRAEASELQDAIDGGNQARRRLDELLVIATTGGAE